MLVDRCPLDDRQEAGRAQTMAAFRAFAVVAARGIGVLDRRGNEPGDRRPVLVGVGGVSYGADHQCRGDKDGEQPAKHRREATVLYNAAGCSARHAGKKRKIARPVKPAPDPA